jgi:hypothetical protein
MIEESRKNTGHVVSGSERQGKPRTRKRSRPRGRS